jgi:hypothetical protein
VVIALVDHKAFFGKHSPPKIFRFVCTRLNVLMAIFLFLATIFAIVSLLLPTAVHSATVRQYIPYGDTEIERKTFKQYTLLHFSQVCSKLGRNVECSGIKPEYTTQLQFYFPMAPIQIMVILATGAAFVSFMGAAKPMHAFGLGIVSTILQAVIVALYAASKDGSAFLFWSLSGPDTFKNFEPMTIMGTAFIMAVFTLIFLALFSVLGYVANRKALADQLKLGHAQAQLGITGRHCLVFGLLITILVFTCAALGLPVVGGIFGNGYIFDQFCSWKPPSSPSSNQTVVESVVCKDWSSQSDNTVNSLRIAALVFLVVTLVALVLAMMFGYLLLKTRASRWNVCLIIVSWLGGTVYTSLEPHFVSTCLLTLHYSMLSVLSQTTSIALMSRMLHHLNGEWDPKWKPPLDKLSFSLGYSFAVMSLVCLIIVAIFMMRLRLA